MDKVPVIQPQDLGLKVCYSPQDVDEIDVDVVAIHGIGADPKTTWTHKKTRVNWLGHPSMLPAALPRARVLSFGYDSVWFGADPVRQSLDSVAVKLLGALVRERSACPSRPIIFIAHCFGGLVIQKAYTMSSLHTSDWPHVSQAMRGMVFLGTPVHGVAKDSALTTQGQIYAAIVAASLQVQDNALHTIAQDNDVLVSAVHEFTRKVTASKSSPRLFCFYEQKATNIGAIASLAPVFTFVVSESSATLSGHEKEGLALDHMGMNKFENEEDNHYQCVLYQVVKMAKEAKEFSEQTETAAAPETPKSPHRPYIPMLPGSIARHNNFAPREDILEQIEVKFTKKARVALCGESGHGKTHIAVEYAHKYHEENPGSKIYWVNASSAEEFELSYSSIAKSRHLPGDARRAGMLSAVHDFLKHDPSNHWLIILDGLDDETCLVATEPALGGKSLLDFVPSSPDGRILITTRNKLLATLLVNGKANYVLSVDVLGKNDASRLLFGRVTSDPAKMTWVEDLASILDSSAGALELARNHRKMAGKEVTRSGYLKALSTNSTSDVTGAQRAWKLLFDFIKSKHSDVVDLTLIIALINVQSLPKVFFSRHEIAKLLPILLDFGIVDQSLDRCFYSMPALFRQCSQSWLAGKPEKKCSIEELALFAMSARLNQDNWQALLPPALALSKLQPGSNAGRIGLERVRGEIAHYRALSGRAENGGTSASLNHGLGPRHASSGRISEAKVSTNGRQLPAALPQQPQGKRRHVSTKIAEAHSRFEKLQSSDLGWENDDTAHAASELAALKLLQGQPSAAEDAVSLYQKLLDISSKSPEVDLGKARSEYNLALAHEAQGQYGNAEKLYLAALKSIGPRINSDNPETASYELFLQIGSSLASMHASAGRLADANAAFATVLPWQWRMLGPDHPLTLGTQHNAAILLQDRGDVEAADEELQRVWERQARLFGGESRDSLRTARSVALGYRLRGDFENSERLYREVLKTQQRVSGVNSFETTKTRQMLNELLQERLVEVGDGSVKPDA